MTLRSGTSRGENVRAVLVRVGLWSLLAFGSNLVWEIAQVRLYTLWADEKGPTIAWALFHCSVGDVMIASAMYAVAGIALRSANWPTSHPWTGGAIVVIGAMAYTAWSEWYNVYRAGNWGYASSMPLIYGIGLSPLLQWIILPAAMVSVFRALDQELFGTQTPSEPLSAHGRTKGST